MARYERSYAGERRTAPLHLQLTPSERYELEAAADRSGAITLSSYAREVLFRRSAEVVAGARRNPDAASLARELNALGNNLNQIARHLNMSGELDPLADLHDMLKCALARVIAL
jgi:hypothetical protein